MTRSARTWRAGTVAVAAGSIVAASLAAVPATAAPNQKGCDNRSNNTYSKLLECVRLGELVEHLEAFQAIADANDGNRADQTSGYAASVDYVVETVEAAGWTAEVVPFTYPGNASLSTGDDTFVTEPFTGTGVGDVTGTIVPVDLALDDPASSSSGCEAADFAGLDFSGDADIALIQRGTCGFTVKANLAAEAGAEAIIIFNQGTADRTGPLTNVTAEPFPYDDIPVVSASFDAGVALAQESGTVTAGVEAVESYNVIAELEGRNDDNVVMAGAHLDSVPEGPGINDNATGSAALLEIAEQMSNTRPENTVRFAWWGAEELGLIGSTEWVEQRTQEELDEIALYLNFDMIGSPNYYIGVYDADESSFEAPVPVPDGSIAIEDTFESFYTLVGEPYDDSAFSGRSDYQAFINNGIASGGLFTGAEVIKTEEQADIWGGTAGEQFDPCYHEACDTIENYDAHAFDVNADAVAFAVLTYAYSTESVNGVEGKKVPGGLRVPAPAGPEGTFPGGLGGDDHGHDHDHEHHDGE